jgi:hypothetical protein
MKKIDNKTKGNMMALAGAFMIVVNGITIWIRGNNQIAVGLIGFLFLIIGINIAKKK